APCRATRQRKAPGSELAEDRKQHGVVVLRRRGEEQAVWTRERPDRLVLAMQALAEREAVRFALEPRRLAPMRPREQPLVLDTRRAQSKPVAAPNTVDDKIDLV